MKFGLHISIAGSICYAINRAEELHCNTFQIFTRNPRSWKSKELTQEIVSDFKLKLKKSKLAPIFSHMPYILNLASSELRIKDLSINSLKEELRRCNLLEIPFIITHLGCLKVGEKIEGLNNIIEALNISLEDFNGKCQILLENTASKCNGLGSTVEDICYIISNCKFSNDIGVCFDTCHAFVSGYDIRKTKIIDNILCEINEKIGLEKLKLIHCNDSKFDLGSGKDRHEHIGLGKIGRTGFLNILKDKRLRDIPFISETPVDERRTDIGNLKYLRKILEEIEKKN